MDDIDLANLERFRRQMSSVDELVQVVLKGHLLIDEALWRVLSRFVFHPEFLDNAKLSFYQKVALARAISLDQHTNRMWDLVMAFNSLRNDLAHSLDSDGRVAKLAKLKEIYFAVCEHESRIEEEKALPEHIVVAFAAALCLGFLSSFEREITRFRSWVDALDRVATTKCHA